MRLGLLLSNAEVIASLSIRDLVASEAEVIPVPVESQQLLECRELHRGLSPEEATCSYHANLEKLEASTNCFEARLNLAPQCRVA